MVSFSVLFSIMQALQSKALPGIKNDNLAKNYFENLPGSHPNISKKRYVCIAVLKNLVKFTLSMSYQSLKNDKKNTGGQPW